MHAIMLSPKRCLVRSASACLLLAGLLVGGLAQPQERRPNIVLVVMDDGGYGDLSSYGATDIKTPHIDSLARDGVKLTDFYANGATCSPTRAGLLTGRYQQRYALEMPILDPNNAQEQGLPVSGRSLPQLLKNSGYVSGLVGKWHLGYKPEFSPLAHGFDYFFGFKAGFIDYYRHTSGDGRPDLFENDEPVERTGYMTDLITERSIAFIRENAGKPFFLDISYNAPHWPYQTPDNPSVAIDNGRHVLPHEAPTGSRAEYAAMFERADAGIGRILAALDELGLAGDTVVMFTHDNGGEWLSRNEPLFHRKGTVWEGGIRVPMLMRWPGVLPAGAVSGQVGATMDITASILALAGAELPPGPALEGMDLLPILSGKTPEVSRTLFWRVTVPGLQRAVRSGDWKLVLDGNVSLLYDLRKDPGERHDLTSGNQEVVRRLRPLILAWEKDVDAEAVANGTIGFNRWRPGNPQRPPAGAGAPRN